MVDRNNKAESQLRGGEVTSASNAEEKVREEDEHEEEDTSKRGGDRRKILGNQISTIISLAERTRGFIRISTH